MNYKHKVAIPENKKDEIIKILKSFKAGVRIKSWTEKHCEDSITTWLKHNTNNEYHWLFESCQISISFNVLGDATAFKLRWL